MTRKERIFINSGRVARLATADGKGRPHVIPICYVLDGEALYFALDEKPKRLSPLRLKRILNIQANPYVSVVVDRYDEDWQRLAYVLISGKARLLFQGKRHERVVTRLRRKYRQYRDMAIDGRPIVQIRPVHCTSWGAV